MRIKADEARTNLRQAAIDEVKEAEMQRMSRV
jgi:hypothetical protein